MLWESARCSRPPVPNPEHSTACRTDEANDDQRHTLRILMTEEDTDLLHETTNVMSNGRLGATVIYREQEIFYDVGIRLKGSQRGRDKVVRVGFNIRFDPSSTVPRSPRNDRRRPQWLR